MTTKLVDQNALCRHCGHPRSEHTPTCQDGGGCGNSCPCRKFVLYVPCEGKLHKVVPAPPPYRWHCIVCGQPFRNMPNAVRVEV